MDKDISFLTEKQKTAYILRSCGMKFSEISKLMKISENSARQHFLIAEKKIKEYENSNGIKEKDLMPLTIDINLGELKVIISGLKNLKLFMWKNLIRKFKSLWNEELPYVYTVAEKLLERLQDICKEND